MGEDSISLRLRQLKDQNDWTAQIMADKTGISRRTLESYMRRKNPALPGLEALRSISEGLGVSLDWLVLGEGHGRVAAVLLVRLATERAALPVLENLLEAIERGEQVPTAEYLASEIAGQAAEKADFIFTQGTTSVMVAQLWKLSQQNMAKSMRDHINDLRQQIDELKVEKSDLTDR